MITNCKEEAVGLDYKYREFSSSTPHSSLLQHTMSGLLRFFSFAAAALPCVLAAPFPSQVSGQIVTGKWIITLQPSADVAAVAAHISKVQTIQARNVGRRAVGDNALGGIERQFGFGGFKAYSGSFDDTTIEELKNLPEVLSSALMQVFQD